MKRIPVSRLSDDAAICEHKESIAQDCPHTARQVELIGEIERRRLFAPAGYPSMYKYCVGELHLSEDAAYKRIQVARVARRYPAVLAALAEGRVHLTGLNLLAPYLKGLEPAIVDELLAAATHKTKKDIEQLLAERFPKPDLPAHVHPIPPAPQQGPTAEPTVESLAQPQVVANSQSELAPAQVGEPVTSIQGARIPEKPRARDLRRGPSLARPDGAGGYACILCCDVPWPRMALMRSTSFRGLNGLVM